MFNRKLQSAATDTFASSAATVALGGQPNRDRHLVDVPASLVSSHANWLSAGFWSGRFDIAVWLRLPQGSETPLQLALRYTDQRGEHSVLVDICKPGTYKSALLNGTVNLEVTGRVKEMGLYLIGLSKGQILSMDEWHFIPQIKRTS